MQGEWCRAGRTRRNGIQVESIRLWLLGGVAQLKGNPRSPDADLRIAAVGPLTSLILGLIYGALAVGLSLAGGGGPPVAVLGYLAGVNVVLTIIPAAPLDGGRVLRPVLWMIWRDQQREAFAAGRAGRIFGYVLVGLGFFQVAYGSGFSGLWLVLIGLFVVNAAAAEEQHGRLGSLLRAIVVGHVMTPNPVVADPEQTVDDFIRRIAFAHPFSSYPLTDPTGRLIGNENDAVVGIVSPSEVSRTMQLASLTSPNTPARGADRWPAHPGT